MLRFFLATGTTIISGGDSEDVVVDTLFLLINRVHYLKGLKMLRIKFNGKRVSLEEWPLKITNINRCNWRPGKELAWDQAKNGRPQSVLNT
jgi:hypothetical protein